MSPGLTSYLDVYIKTSKYAQDRLTARFTRFARAHDLVAALAASRIRHHGCHRQYIRRSAARRGGLALPRAVSDGGSGLDSRGVDQERHRSPRPDLRVDRRRQEATECRRVALAVSQPANQSGSPGGM